MELIFGINNFKIEKCHFFVDHFLETRPVDVRISKMILSLFRWKHLVSIDNNMSHILDSVCKCFFPSTTFFPINIYCNNFYLISICSSSLEYSLTFDYTFRLLLSHIKIKPQRHMINSGTVTFLLKVSDTTTFLNESQNQNPENLFEMLPLPLWSSSFFTRVTLILERWYLEQCLNWNKILQMALTWRTENDIVSERDKFRIQIPPTWQDHSIFDFIHEIFVSFFLSNVKSFRTGKVLDQEIFCQSYIMSKKTLSIIFRLINDMEIAKLIRNLRSGAEGIWTCPQLIKSQTKTLPTFDT